jgi:hypothetical protein
LSSELKKQRIKHGGKYTRLYHTWKKMKERCNNPNCKAYKDYGGRGIKICDEWNNDYVSFREWAMNNGYNDLLTIDRIDNNNGYFPQNCRWVTAKIQNLNRRTNHYLTFNGETKTISEWADITGINSATIGFRINHLHWPVDKALTQKVRHKTGLGNEV